MKRIIPFLLAVLMVAGIVSSCNSANTNENAQENGEQNITGGEDAQGQDTETTQEEAKILPDLPESDFGGYVFTVLSHREESDDWFEPDPREITVEVENAEDPINDAVYKRNAMLKDKYNIDFALVTNTDENSLLRKAVSSGDDAYDAVLIFNNNVPTAVNSGYLTNIENLTYVDLSKPWWDPAVNAMSICNKNFLLAGDMLILDNEATEALIFNKDLMRELGKELPYGLVKDGKWTFDQMNELIKDAAKDLNGDGTMIPADDRWGFVIYKDTLHALLCSGGGALAVKNQEDIPYMDFASKKNLTVIEKAMDMLYNKDQVMNIQKDVETGGTGNPNWTGTIRSVFEENRALFMWVRMRVVEKFRGMESEFGILPLPKYDEAQEDYYSVVNPYTGVMLGVPKSAQDLDRTSIILEAMAAESKYTLRPAYYDVVLQRKFTRDEESSEMLDIIFNSRVYDIGGVYSFGNVFMDFIELSITYNTNVISYYEKKQGAMEKAIEKVITTFQDME